MPIQPATYAAEIAFLNRQFPGFDPAQFASLIAASLINYIPGPFTVATLPSAAAYPAAMAFVTNALNPLNGQIIVGSGTTYCPVYSNGANWLALVGGAVGATVTITATPYVPVGGVSLVRCNFSGSGVINLPAVATRNDRLTIKDVSGAASSNNITINANGADTIDGSASLVIGADYGAFTLSPATGKWDVI